MDIYMPRLVPPSVELHWSVGTQQYDQSFSLCGSSWYSDIELCFLFIKHLLALPMWPSAYVWYTFVTFYFACGVRVLAWAWPDLSLRSVRPRPTRVVLSLEGASGTPMVTSKCFAVATTGLRVVWYVLYVLFCVWCARARARAYII